MLGDDADAAELSHAVREALGGARHAQSVTNHTSAGHRDECGNKFNLTSCFEIFLT